MNENVTTATHGRRPPTPGRRHRSGASLLRKVIALRNAACSSIATGVSGSAACTSETYVEKADAQHAIDLIMNGAGGATVVDAT